MQCVSGLFVKTPTWRRLFLLSLRVLSTDSDQMLLATLPSASEGQRIRKLFTLSKVRGRLVYSQYKFWDAPWVYSLRERQSLYPPHTAIARLKMSFQTQHEAQHHRLRRYWPAKFENRRRWHYSSENQAWIDELRSPPAGLDGDDDESSSSDNEEESDSDGDHESVNGSRNGAGDDLTPHKNDVMGILLQALKETHQDQVEKIQGFCARGLDDLELTPSRKSRASLALVDQRSIASDRPRENRGQFTAQNLLEELGRPVRLSLVFSMVLDRLVKLG